MRRLPAIAILLVLLAPAHLRARRGQQFPAPDDQQRALHALNRLTFGPRPGEVERVAAIGVDKWIELQLHPEKIDDSALASRLAPFRTLQMSTAKLIEDFPPRAVIQAVAEGRHPLPSDPEERAIYQAQLERYREKRKQNDSTKVSSSEIKTADKTNDRGTDESRVSALPETAAQEIVQLPSDKRMDAILRLGPEQQESFLHDLPEKQRSALLADLSPRDRETVMALQNPQQVVLQELASGRLMRDIYSERQLQEVMTDFWLNHFNVFAGKGADHYLVTSYERDVIRPRALGKFKDLLLATAQSPAMLFYLDNWMSVGPSSDVAQGASFFRGRRGGASSWAQRWSPRAAAKKKSASGLNENYARELMELHTLSVNGGYRQQDVIEVAKAFTGWTIQKPALGGVFLFDERMHEPGDKHVLGHRIKEDGEKEGTRILDLLAHNPATTRFICTKLAQRFVSDNPPPQLVASMVHTFKKKDGDIREVLRTMFRSPEFWDPSSYRAKVKTPLEFVVSAVRATAADVGDPQALVRALNRMGEPIYGCQPPNGYSMLAESWVNSSALLERMNFSLAITSGRIPGITTHLPQFVPEGEKPNQPEQVLTELEKDLLDGNVSTETHATIAKQIEDPRITQRRLDDPPRQANTGIIAGLLLGSPEFQRR